MQDSHPLARLRLETAWANQMTWNTALIVNFCFETNPQTERSSRIGQWHELWDLVQKWAKERPEGFDAIWQGSASETEGSCFPQMWFTADWHGTFNLSVFTGLRLTVRTTAVAFGLYHFSCIMLLSFKPGPRFAIRNIARISSTDVSNFFMSYKDHALNLLWQRQILEHAQAICGACKSTPETVQLSIILCHTIFVWGPLVTETRERDEVVQLLEDFEKSNVWPTTWIINALKMEWGLDPRE
jgi:hypothetical protein